MSESTFRIDIENSSGNRLGSGPITSAAQWTYTARMDKAGEFSFRMPATDAQASIVQRKRIARAWALVGGAWVEVGAGIIDNIVRRPQADGTVMLVAPSATVSVVMRRGKSKAAAISTDARHSASSISEVLKASSYWSTRTSRRTSVVNSPKVMPGA